MLNEVKLFYCTITGKRWKNELEINVKNLYNFVDFIIIIDGNYAEDKTTHDELKKLDKDNKVIWVDLPWADNFPLQRTRYLDEVGKVVEKYNLQNKSCFVLRPDSDEHFSPMLVKNLKSICEAADRKGHEMLRIRVHDIDLDRDRNRIKNTTGEYFKGLIYKWLPGLKYVAGGYGSPVHEDYNYRFRGIEVDRQNEETLYFYEHLKSQGDVWERSSIRNLWCGGSGDNLGELNLEWLPYKELVLKCYPEVKTWHDLSKIVKEGNIDRRLKNWIIKFRYEGVRDNRDFNKYPKSRSELFFETYPGIMNMSYSGSSETREFFMYYFWWLHPQEMLELDEYIIRESPLSEEAKTWYKENKR